MYKPHFAFHASVNGHLGSQLLAIVNNVAVNIKYFCT